MLSHTRNRQSRWIKVTEAFKDKAVASKVKAEAELTTDLSLRTQTHSDRLHAADEKCHVKRHKSLIRNANWTNKTMYSISIVTVANSCAMFTKGLTRCLNRFKDSMITIVSSMK